MATKDLRYLIGKALTDDAFKAELLGDPRAAATAQDCKITDAQVSALKSMNEDDWKQIEKVLFDTMLATSECIG